MEKKNLTKREKKIEKLTSGDKINIFTFPEISHEIAFLPKRKLSRDFPPSCHSKVRSPWKI